MEQPQQTPPVDRQYMRDVVGRKGKSAGGSDGAPPPRVKRRTQHGHREAAAPASGNFVVELTVVGVRPSWRRRA